MARCLSPIPKLQFFLPGTNTPLAGGLLFTYAAGTTTKQTTYSNDTGTPNTNPIILDANGQCVVFLDSTVQYAFTLSPSTDTDPPTHAYWTVDNMGYQELISGLAPLASPAFTGTPTAPTPTLGDNSQNIATTQFVQNTITAGLTNIALTGTPTAPTASPGTLTTQIASTAFVGAEIAKAPTMQVFTNSGTFTVPPSVTRVKYRAWGPGGGAGGNTGSSVAGGAGGGGGGYAEGIATVTPAGTLAVVIGTAGTGGTGAATGTTGTATTIGTIGISCASGTGGTGGSSLTATVGGSGGVASGGQINITGGVGDPGLNFGGANLPGRGGGSFSSAPSSGNGTYPGGGGGGGSNGGNGLNGAAGLVIFEWLAP